MLVILCEDVDNLGDMGETVKVADGYARNFLLPNKLAVRADSASAKQIEHELKIIRKRDAKRREELEAVAKKLEHVTVEIKMRAGEGDKLFGSVTSSMIAEDLERQGYSVDRKKIKLAQPIKTLGTFEVPVRFVSGIEPTVKVWVSRDAEAEAEAAEEAVAEPGTETPEEATPEEASAEAAVAEEVAE